MNRRSWTNSAAREPASSADAVHQGSSIARPIIWCPRSCWTVDLAECRDLIDAGADRARDSDDSYWLSTYLFRRSYLHWAQARGDRVHRVVPYVEEALAVARTHGHRRVAARAASLLSLCRVAERDWRGAHSAMTVALADLREIGDRPATVSAMQSLAAIHTELEDTAAAGSWLRDAIVETQTDRLWAGRALLHAGESRSWPLARDEPTTPCGWTTP